MLWPLCTCEEGIYYSLHSRFGVLTANLTTAAKREFFPPLWGIRPLAILRVACQ